MPVEIINTEKFKEVIFDETQNQEFTFKKERPIILNFFAVWCGPCQIFAPALETIADQYGDHLDVYKIDIDSDPQVPALFGIRSVPTTVFFAPNQEPALAMGNLGVSGLQRAVKDIFNLEGSD